jgi:hypothetical protein
MLPKSFAAVVCIAVLSSVGVGVAQEAPLPEQVGLSARLVDAAVAYERYVAEAGAIRADFRDPAQVRAALKAGAAYEASQLEQGEIAYAAMVALQDPQFVVGVRRLAAMADARDAAADQLLLRPDLAADLPGAASAAARVSSALRAQGEQVAGAGRRVKQAAYDVQRQPWSVQKVADGPARLVEVKAISATPFRPRPEDTNRFVASVGALGDDPLAGEGRVAPSPVVNRALALAALALLGRADEQHEAALAPLLAEARSAGCLKMAKLNLYQCLAVAGPHYEDVFCLGQHALIDTGRCVAAGAGAPLPAAITEAALTSSAPAPGAVMIPVASGRR